MTINAYEDPLAALYTTVSEPFEGYHAEGTFEHGKPVVVARIPREHIAGYPSIIYEQRLPASCMTAFVLDREKPILKFGTGSGTEIAQILHRVCTAFSNGHVQLTPSRMYPHSVGVGIGFERVELYFADRELFLDTASNLKSGMLVVSNLR